MDKKLKFTGGEPNINFDDILRTPNATRDALIDIFRAFGDNYIIQGVTGTTSITAGYVMLDGEILKVDAHTQTNTHFVKVTTYEAGGDKTFNDSVARQTWQKNRATISAGSGSLAYAGAKRMPNVLVDTITAGTSIIAQANLPIATTAQKGIIEILTQAEANAGTDATRALTALTGKNAIVSWNNAFTSLTLNSNWSGTINYRINIIGQLEIKANITRSAAGGTDVATLPTGYRPSVGITQYLYGTPFTDEAELYIGTNGVISSTSFTADLAHSFAIAIPL